MLSEPVVTSYQDGGCGQDLHSWRRQCGCLRTSEKLKKILQSFPSSAPACPTPMPSLIDPMESQHRATILGVVNRQSEAAKEIQNLWYKQTWHTDIVIALSGVTASAHKQICTIVVLDRMIADMLGLLVSWLLHLLWGLYSSYSTMSECHSNYCTHMHTTGAYNCCEEETSHCTAWQIVGEVVQLVQLSVTATALALYYIIYCYMQLVYYTLQSALYFHNADVPMKITIGVVTVTSLVVGFNLILRMERVVGLLY